MAGIRSADCPSNQEIDSFLHGYCVEAEAERIVSHADRCPACAALLRQRAGDSDTIVHLMRLDGDDFESEPAFRTLQRQLFNAAAPPFASLELPVVLGQYELLEPLGQGGMGRVFKAQHLHLKRMVVVKLLAPERLDDRDAAARFLLEIEAVGRLTHPNVVRATDAACVDGIYFLVMDFEPGLDVGALLNRLTKLDVADACEVARQAALGLQFAHEHGLVHCDVKPSNLLVTDEGTVKVLDLGLARFSSERRDEVRLSVAGTIDYMAPEQWSLGAEVDIRADVYGLGCTLFKLLAGRAPFESPGATISDRQIGHRAGNIPSLETFRPDVPVALEVVVNRMLAKEPQQRFGKPQEVVEALNPFCHGSQLSALVNQASIASNDTVRMHQRDATAVVPPVKRSAPNPRRRYAWAATLICIVFGVGTAFITSRRGDGGLKSVSLKMPRAFASRDPDCLVTANTIQGHEGIELRSKQPLFIPVGSATSIPFQLRATLTDDFSGSPGIYFGFENPIGQGRNPHFYQSVTVNHDGAPSGSHGWIRWTAHEERSTQLAQIDHVLNLWPIDIDDHQKIHVLEIGIGKDGMNVVWDGTTVATTATPKAAPISIEGRSGGAFGLFLNSGDAIFAEFGTRLNQGENDK